jgi:hypothetical protein
VPPAMGQVDRPPAPASGSVWLKEPERSWFKRLEAHHTLDHSLGACASSFCLPCSPETPCGQRKCAWCSG